MSVSCSHSAETVEVPPPAMVCETCVTMGGRWVHLRQCLTCGLTGCCDQSPNRHATGHFHASGHPMVRSAERGEVWRWCYADEVFWVPGPAGYRVYEPSDG